MLLTMTLTSHAQQTDPALTAAVTGQTFTLKSLFDARKSTQQKILTATGIEEVQLKQLHDIEKKVLDYMANVSGLMQNLYQVKRTTELVTVEIPRNISAVSKATKGHLSKRNGHCTGSIRRDSQCLYRDWQPVCPLYLAGQDQNR